MGGGEGVRLKLVSRRSAIETELDVCRRSTCRHSYATLSVELLQLREAQNMVVPGVVFGVLVSLVWGLVNIWNNRRKQQT